MDAYHYSWMCGRIVRGRDRTPRQLTREVIIPIRYVSFVLLIHTSSTDPQKAMGIPISLALNLSRQASRYKIDEAVAVIGEIHRQLEAIEDYRLKLKWWIGHVLTHTEYERRKRTEMVTYIAERLQSEFSIRARRTVLYESAKLYEAFAGDFLQFSRWIEDQKRLRSRPVYWYDVEKLVLGGRHNPDVIGRDLADELDYREAERAVETIEKIVMRASEGNEEADGVLEAVRQNLEGLFILHAREPRTPRSDHYLRFVSSFPCLICSRPADAHHAIGQAGTGIKPSDFGTVPLCRLHHVELHQSGPRTFEDSHGLQLIEAAFNLLHRYVAGTWVTMKLDAATRDPA